MCGDANNPEQLALLVGETRIDAIVTDPPYGIGHDTDYSRCRIRGTPTGKKYKPVHGDKTPFDPRPWLRYPLAILFGANCFSWLLPRGTLLIWDKRWGDHPNFFSDGECAWMSKGHGLYIFKHPWNGATRASERGKHLHPTQKPVALMQWCLSKTPAGAAVLDPYAGSGPVMAACELTERTCYAMEIEPEYCTAILDRMTAMGIDPALVSTHQMTIK